MKVILTQDVKATGKKGQVIEVSDGFAKNFLIAKGKAIKATNTELNEHAGKQSSDAFHEAERKKMAQDLAKQLDKKQITLKAKCGELGKVYGSITSKEISEALAESGLVVDKRKIELGGVIKNVGKYSITARLYPQVTATFTLNVEAV